MNRPEPADVGAQPVEMRPATELSDVAVGDAIGSTAHSVSPPVTAESTVLQDGTDAANIGSTTRKPRADQRNRDLTAIADALSERDWEVLKSVAAHRFLTTAQITRLHFADHTASSGPTLTRRVLGRLRGRRVLSTLQRRVGGVRAGSSGLVYYVDVVGDRLLRRDENRSSRRRFSEPSPTFLNHTLSVVETHISLVDADRDQTCQLVRCDVEPASWRKHLGLGGAHLTLKPDLYAETAVDADSPFVNSWFIEVDLGTEHLPTLMRKCHDYDAYYRSGTEQEESGGFPLIVWIMSARDPAVADRRRAALSKAIDGDSRLDRTLFRVIAPDQWIDLVRKRGDT